MNWIDIVKVVSDLAVIPGMAVLTMMLNWRHTENKDRLEEIKSQLRHLDGCVDELKLGFAKAAQIDDLRHRVTRLENRVMKLE